VAATAVAGAGAGAGAELGFCRESMMARSSMATCNSTRELKLEPPRFLKP
jgi:hypothetical protein